VCTGSSGTSRPQTNLAHNAQNKRSPPNSSPSPHTHVRQTDVSPNPTRSYHPTPTRNRTPPTRFVQKLFERPNQRMFPAFNDLMVCQLCSQVWARWCVLFCKISALPKNQNSDRETLTEKSRTLTEKSRTKKSNYDGKSES
jgi:hypothetical protein